MQSTPTKNQLSAQQSYSYLQAMGIKLWVPRLELPNAAPSVQCEWDKPEAASRPRVVSSRQEIQQKESQQQEVQQAAVREVLNEAAPVAELEALSLSVWQLANSWQLVLPQQITAPAINLLTNILYALHPQTLGINKQLGFNWPMPNLPSNLTKEEAAFSLQAFLTGANFNQLKAEGCIIFAPEVKPLLPILNQLKPNHFYLAANLEEMLQKPSLKAEFWQQAQATNLLDNFKACWVRI